MITQQDLLKLGFIKETYMLRTYYYFNHNRLFSESSIFAQPTIKGYIKDKEFLEENAGGSYSRYDTIEKLIKRLCELNYRNGWEGAKMAVKEFLSDI